MVKIAEDKKVKIKYTGPEHKILITKTHNSFTLKNGDVIDVTKEEANELLKVNKNPRYKDKKFELVKTIKEVKSNG